MNKSGLPAAAIVAALLLTVTRPALADDTAVKAMSQGGHAILLRHARLGGHSKSLVLDPEGNCANEENLSDEGRAQARHLKAMLDQAGVKFDVVLASPFCRTKETAQLAFGQAAVDPNLMALELGTADEVKARTQRVTEVIARQAGKGNIALVTHRPNIDALTMELVEEGEAIVARIERDGTLFVVGRVRP
jgi:broad specificity phosphatase PhoE